MKTFLGFTTGLFSGTIVGVLFTAAMLLVNEDLRDYVDTVANGINDT